MGRNKINISFIKDDRVRNVSRYNISKPFFIQITFNKRKNGLLKKAAELAVLCNIKLVLSFTDLCNYQFNKTLLNIFFLTFGFIFCNTDGNVYNLLAPDTTALEVIKSNHTKHNVYHMRPDDYPRFSKRGVESDDEELESSDSESRILIKQERSVDKVPEQIPILNQKEKKKIKLNLKIAIPNSELNEVKMLKQNHLQKQPQQKNDSDELHKVREQKVEDNSLQSKDQIKKQETLKQQNRYEGPLESPNLTPNQMNQLILNNQRFFIYLGENTYQQQPPNVIQNIQNIHNFQTQPNALNQQIYQPPQVAYSNLPSVQSNYSYVVGQPSCQSKPKQINFSFNAPDIEQKQEQDLYHDERQRIKEELPYEMMPQNFIPAPFMQYPIATQYYPSGPAKGIQPIIPTQQILQGGPMGPPPVIQFQPQFMQFQNPTMLFPNQQNKNPQQTYQSNQRSKK